MCAISALENKSLYILCFGVDHERILLEVHEKRVWWSISGCREICAAFKEAETCIAVGFWEWL